MPDVKVINSTIHTAKIVLYKDDKEGRRLYLLVKEQEGFFNLPGGAQDEEDYTLTDTAIREIYEELGLTAKSCRLHESGVIHEFMHTDKNSPRYGKKGVLHVFTAEYNNLEDIKLADDLLAYEWVDAVVGLNLLDNEYPYLAGVFYKTINLH